MCEEDALLLGCFRVEHSMVATFGSLLSNVP